MEYTIINPIKSVAHFLMNPIVSNRQVEMHLIFFFFAGSSSFFGENIQFFVENSFASFMLFFGGINHFFARSIKFFGENIRFFAKKSFGK